ncbi:hypothetical protein NGB36_13050 [Streptomyces sp. RB6PN25]|uniref:Integral membrane protein n=1 Tax=Streptomyces humicola TaxID=2953240 RepID=A0ABT1PWP1_9ACTN|nr:hypothetical protein [Streptomyces humicola]MCQ4081503.1 hypothetical protein [Streptomyces humicola]
MEGTPQLREVRAALFAAVCTTLSCTSHVMLSRMPLPVTTVAVVYVAVFALAYTLAGRERGFRPIAALLVPLELCADTLFTAGQHTCYGPAGGPVTGPLASFGADLICNGGRVGTPLAGGAPVTADRALPWLLLSAHVTVGLLASWWLRRGEAAVYRLLRAAASCAYRPLALAAAVVRAHAGVPPRPAARCTGAAPAVPALPLLLHSVIRRGPPCLATA